MTDSIHVIARRTFQEALEAAAADPVIFCQEFLDQSPHDGQAVWFRTRPEAQERMLSAGNRFGKSFIGGMHLLHKCFFQIRDPRFAYDGAGNLRTYTAISVSLSLDQATLSWQAALAAAQNCPKFSRFITDVNTNPFPVLKMGVPTHGKERVVSEYWARSTAKRARFLLGHSFSTLLYDEAAFDPDGEDILANVIKMRMADEGGQIQFISSPAGRQNWFYKQYLKGVGDTAGYYYSQTGMTFENPHVNHEYIAQTASGMTRDQIRQNIFGEFVETSSVFSSADIMRCYQDQDYSLPVPAHYDVVYVEEAGSYRARFARSETPPRYVMGADLARKGDQTAIYVLRSDVVPAQMVAGRLLAGRTGRVPWDTIYQALKSWQVEYGAPLLIDSTGMGGDVILETLKGEPWNMDVTGYNYVNHTAKMNLLTHLQEALQRRRITFPYQKTLVDQLLFYDYDDRKLATDAVMGLALAWECALQQIGGNPAMLETPAPVVLTRKRDLATGERLALGDALDPFDEPNAPEDEVDERLGIPVAFRGRPR